MTETPSSERPQGFIFPWWISILGAILVYTSLSYLLPGLSPENPTLQTICRIAPDIAPVLTIPFLLLGAKQLYDGVPQEDEQQ